MCPCSQLRNVHRISVLLDQSREIVRAQPHGGRVVVRVHAEEPRRGEKRFVEIKLRLALCIVEQAERRHGAGNEPQHLHEVVFGRERQRARAVFVPELLEVDALVAPDGDEVVIALFIVAHEQILGVGLRAGERHVRELGHVVDRLALRDLVPDPAAHAATLGIQRLRLSAIRASAACKAVRPVRRPMQWTSIAKS